MKAVLEGYAGYYSADLSEKVSRGMTDNALKCKYNGGTLPISYVIVPDGIPPIVPQGLFDRVQEKMAKNKKAPHPKWARGFSVSKKPRRVRARRRE